jgi:two-component system, OmpR family, response regulator
VRDLDVLLVDADGTIRAVFDEVFAGIAAVRTTASVDEALGVLATGWQPHVIVVDPAMGATDGLDLVRAVRVDPTLQGVSVVVLTSDGSAEARDRSLASGADEVVLKPFDPLTLDHRLRALAGVA